MKPMLISGRPDAPHNCSIFNQTSDSLHVECVESFDGGLPQKFTVEVEVDASSNVLKAGTLLYNYTSKTSSFSINNLDPGTTYLITLFSSNEKGRSEPVLLRSTTLNLPERRTGKCPLPSLISY